MASRPQELRTWLTTGKRSLDRIPAVVDACTYGTEWVKWWTAAQPQERDTQQWPFPKNVNGDGGWHRFPANGKDGIFTAVMALSWWARAIKSPSEIPFFEEATTDLHWVIQELIRIKTSHQLPPSLPLPPPQSEDGSLPSLPSQNEDGSLPPPPSQSEDDSHLSHPMADPPASSSRSHAPSSHRRAPTSGAPIHQRAEGKRVVRPTWKLKATQ